MNIFYNNKIKILNHSFLTDYKIGGCLFGSVQKSNIITPYESTAIDMDKKILIQKIYQERLERYRLGINFKNNEKIDCLEMIEFSIKEHNRSKLSFGCNDEFGDIDTTGTASGSNSRKLKEKALLELIEKNESILLWYLQKGKAIIIDDEIRSWINRIGYFSSDIYIFSTSNLCNYTTFIVLLFSNKKVVASGVSVNRDSQKGLKTALIEAKLLESIYRDSPSSPYKNYTQNESKVIYEYVNKMNNTMNKVRVNKKLYGELEIIPWIKNIEYGVLNNKLYQQYITIRCFSKDLLNCIGSKENIKQSRQCTIVQKYNIYNDYFNLKPDCVVY